MSFQWVCLCGVLLSISVQGFNYSFQGWTMSGADVVSAVEGASAVLPFHFTHPPTEKTLTGTIKWYKIKSRVKSVTQLVFNCTCPSFGSSRCDRATQEVRGDRFTFVGNLCRRDASVMVDRLSREDEAQYWSRVELNIGNFQTALSTNLTVRAPDGKDSVVSGTEGDSVTLPCVFQRPLSDLTLHTVTWMMKDPYWHVVTFRHRSDGSWVAESDATRYELVGDLEHGNASTRINQLSVRDSHGYLCLVESRKPADFRYPRKYYDHVKTPYIYLSQCEAHLVDSPVSLNPTFIYVPVLLVLLITLGIILLIFRKKVNLCPMICSSDPKRNTPSSTRPGGRGEKKQQSVSGDNNRTYEALMTNRETGDNNRTYEALMTNRETDTCTYASLVVGGGEAQAPEAHGAGGLKIGVRASDGGAIYINVGMNQ
ncbi:uncharacterized protein [Narcine bancroftii]|uniref:uncharacterized protein isoform X2 n=1 Tax=Narcine bancroftii TaxID=1343680 RepID=UPI0038316BB4